MLANMSVPKNFLNLDISIFCKPFILNAKKPAPGKDIKIYEKNGNV